MALPDILHRGATKNLRGKPGVGPYIIEFTDRFAAHGWGDMPEEVQGKATGAAFLAWFFFEHLGSPQAWQDAALFGDLKDNANRLRFAQTGLPHHMIGLAGGDLRPLSLDREILSPSKHLLVQPLAYPLDGEDGNATAVGPDRVLPVTVQFEFTGDDAIRPGVTLHGMCDKNRRTLSPEEAAVKCGLAAGDIGELLAITGLIAMRLRKTLDDIKVKLTAGRLHFAVIQDADGRRDFMLVDALGPESLKMEAAGARLSPDVLDDGYRGSNWLAAVHRARELAVERGEGDWKRICQDELKAHPPLLSPMVKEKAAMIYLGLAKALCRQHFGKPVFANAWDLPRLTAALAPRALAA